MIREAARDLSFAAGILAARPFSCLIQVTNRCNMRCSFCDFWPNGVAPEQELSVADYRSFEEQLADAGRFLISIEGGEPLLRPDLDEIIAAFAVRHLPVLYTNGWYVDAPRARRLFDAGLVQVGVSIDHADPARHDAGRGLADATKRAWQAVEALRDAAPHGGRQVHVMTVLMQSTIDGLEALLEQSRERGVGHAITLLSESGFRRGRSGERAPAPGVSARLMELWRRYPHFRVWREYLELIDTHLTSGPMPVCRAGLQTFNVDHIGNVSACIETIDRAVGNVRREPLREILARLRGLDWVGQCQSCWTLCRGMGQLMGQRGRPRSWVDFAGRMRSA